MSPGRAAALAILAVAAAGSAAAQDLERLARQAGEADPLVFGFPARPNVCGAGDAILIRDEDGGNTFISGRASGRDWRGWREGEPPCETGAVVVRMWRDGPSWSDVEMRVGAADAGRIPSFGGQEAADFLLARAGVAGAGAARRMIQAASLADGAVTWPPLLRLARDRTVASGTRKTALFWLARGAAAEAVRELGGIVRDQTEADEVREAAVFALSQLPRDEGVPLLIELARGSEDPRIRKRALFWLADTEDPRALALFEEILTGG